MGCGLSRAHSTEHRIARVYTSSCRGRSAARTLAPGTTGGAMSVKVLLEFQTQADQVDAAKEFLREVLPDTRAYDGFESLTMHQSDDDPTKFLFWEQWMSRQHYETYLAWRIETGTLKQFVDMLTDEPTIRVFNHVGV